MNELILSLLKREPDKFLAAIERHRQALQRPPKTHAEYLATLTKQGLGKTVAAIIQSGWVDD